MVVTLVSFLHFSVYRHQALTPSVAFTSVRFPLLICLEWLFDGVFAVVPGHW